MNISIEQLIVYEQEKKKQEQQREKQRQHVHAEIMDRENDNLPKHDEKKDEEKTSRMIVIEM